MPDFDNYYLLLYEMIKNDPALAEEMRREEEKEIVVEDITLEEILEDISNGALVNFGNSNLEEMIRERERERMRV